MRIWRHQNLTTKTLFRQGTYPETVEDGQHWSWLASWLTETQIRIHQFHKNSKVINYLYNRKTEPILNKRINDKPNQHWQSQEDKTYTKPKDQRQTKSTLIIIILKYETTVIGWTTHVDIDHEQIHPHQLTTTLNVHSLPKSKQSRLHNGWALPSLEIGKENLCQSHLRRWWVSSEYEQGVRLGKHGKRICEIEAYLYTI